MTYSLALSLGHNSSAVLIQDGVVLAGYEEERFNGIKSSSAFPITSIQALRTQFKLPKDTNVYVGHWFNSAELPSKNKYWHPEYLQEIFPNGTIESLSQDFTHHDSHLESAIVFAGGRDFADSYTAIIADGFGSFGECISIYSVNGRSYKLIKRVFGFDKSLGLFYQYATAFMGMKMHNHEYKMLAYEVHLPEVLSPKEMSHLSEMAMDIASKWLKCIFSPSLSNEFDPVTNVEALPMIQMHINDILTKVLKHLGKSDVDERSLRVIISWFVQATVEMVIVELARLYSKDNLIVAGGLFHNVKLNHILANMVPGKFCAMPLCGDQGAGLGVYEAYNGDLKWPDHLCWGPRPFNFDLTNLPPGFMIVDSEAQAEPLIHAEIQRNGWVNLVRGALEFGPRALCNTSTIAVPNADVAKSINQANNRTMEMPFAPVMNKEQAVEYFYDTEKVHKSLEYMIMTREFKPGMAEKVPGAAHHYPSQNISTGRPQITNDGLMCGLLNTYGPLINTSFNFHGVPIVNTDSQILHTHNMQWKTAPELKPTTIVIRGK